MMGMFKMPSALVNVFRFLSPKFELAPHHGFEVSPSLRSVKNRLQVDELEILPAQGEDRWQQP